MNDLDHDLEMELRQLRPAEPPARMASAIDHDLREDTSRGWSPRVRVSLWASWALTAAAAALAIAAWWPASIGAGTAAQSTTVTPESNVVPIASTNVLWDARDEGIVVLDDGSAARKVRLHYVDTVRLQDRDASSSIAVSRPREEVRFVPVSFY